MPTTPTKQATMSLSEKLRLFADLAPLLLIVQQIAMEPDEGKRAGLILDALQFLAGKTTTPDDDEALQLLENVLKSPEGAALFAWVVNKFEAKA